MRVSKGHKVLFVTSYSFPYHAGGGLNAVNFGKYLISKGIQAKILTFNRNLKLPFNSIIDGLPIIRIPYFNKGLLLKLVSLCFIIPYYLFEIITNDIIIIYGGYIIAWEFIPLFGRLFRKQVIFRSTMYGEDDIDSLLKYSAFLKPIRKFSLNQITNYFALTPDFSLSYKKIFFTDDKIIETPQGVNVEIFSPVNNEYKKSLRNKLNIPEETFTIISVGALVIRKGYMKIFNELIKLDFPFIYIVLGDYDLSHENVTTEKMIKAKEIYSHGKQLLADKICFKGFVDNVNEYLQISDIFLTASVKEGLSNALLESMACGLTVILKDLNNIRGYLLNHNSNCYLYEKENEISNSIAYLYKNPEIRKMISKNASDIIRKSYSFYHVVNHLNIK